MSILSFVEAGNYDIQYIPSPLNPLKRAHNAIAHGQAGTLQTNTGKERLCNM